MPQTKQPDLNGAYYGPSIPPSKTYHRPGRGGGFNCFSCLCSCICSLIFQILFTILFIVGLVVFILWLIFRPNVVKFHVTEATLTDFSLTANNTLHYNLDLNMTVRNPNRRMGIYYDRIEARALYQDERFNSVFLTPFYQGHKTTDYLNPVFNGHNILLLGNSDLSKYNSERSSGRYSIDVKLYLRVRFKFGAIRSPRFRPKIECDLRIPLQSNGTTSGGFETTKCDYDW